MQLKLDFVVLTDRISVYDEGYSYFSNQIINTDVQLQKGYSSDDYTSCSTTSAYMSPNSTDTSTLAPAYYTQDPNEVKSLPYIADPLDNLTASLSTNSTNNINTFEYTNLYDNIPQSFWADPNVPYSDAIKVEEINNQSNER